MRPSIIIKANDLISSGRQAEERRQDHVCVLALVDTTAPRELAACVRDAFDPQLPTAEVRVVAAASGVDLLAPTVPDVCVAVLGTNADAISAGVCELAAAGVPVALVAESALDMPELPLGATAAERVSMLAASTADVLSERLATWLVAATHKGVAFAANFPFCRKAKARELIKDYAVENAVGTTRLLSAGDLSDMAINQARLALDIAALNGRPLALGRIPEVLSAVGAGLGSSVVADSVVGRLPAVGWLVKVFLGYLGTQATGLTLQRRFDKKDRREPGGSGEHGERTLVPTREDAPRSGLRAAGSDASSAAPEPPQTLPGSPDEGYLVYEQGSER